jgi:DNA repair photolyase
MCRFTGHKESWGDFLDVKVNFPEVLKKQLSGRVRKEGRVILGTVTDAYQPAEARYGITRKSLEILAAYPSLEVHLLTKSDLVARDLDILQQLQNCQVGFTITSLNEKAARILESGASSPQSRLNAARQLIKAGIRVWVFIAPLLPGISDSEAALNSLFDSLAQAGVQEILIDSLTPYPAVVHRLKSAYRDSFPRLLPELESYLDQSEVYTDRIKAQVENIARSYGCRPEFL